MHWGEAKAKVRERGMHAQCSGRIYFGCAGSGALGLGFSYMGLWMGWVRSLQRQTPLGQM